MLIDNFLIYKIFTGVLNLKLSNDSFAKLFEVSTASLTSELLKLGFRNTFIRGLQALHPAKRLVGYAFSLRYIPAREDDNSTNPQRIAVETTGRPAPSSTTSLIFKYGSAAVVSWSDRGM